MTAAPALLPAPADARDQVLVPPSNLDAEAAVLSAELLFPHTIDEVVEIVQPEDFYADAHRRIQQAIVAVREHGANVDPVTVAGWLHAQNRLQQIGGRAYLVQIVGATPAYANVADHARLVRDCAVQRRAIAELRRLLADAYAHPGAVTEWLEDFERTAHQVTAPRQDADLGEEVGVVAARVYEQTGQTARGEIAIGLTSGFPEFDARHGRFDDGDMIIVAGRPGMGKTSFAWQACDQALDPGETKADEPELEPEAWGVFFSLEMTREKLLQRAISNRSGIPLTLLRRGELTAEQWRGAYVHSLAHKRLPLFVDDRRGLTPARMRSRIRRYAAIARRRWPKARLRIIGVDYLQLMSGDDPRATGNERIESNSRELKTMAGEFNACVIALSQLNREVEKRDKKDRRPTLADLRGSGAIEQDADSVLFVYREDYYREQRGEYGERDGRAEIVIAKGRNAGTGLVHLKFEGTCTRFDSLTEDQQAELDFERQQERGQ